MDKQLLKNKKATLELLIRTHINDFEDITGFIVDSLQINRELYSSGDTAMIDIKVNLNI